MNGVSTKLAGNDSATICLARVNVIDFTLLSVGLAQTRLCGTAVTGASIKSGQSEF